MNIQIVLLAIVVVAIVTLATGDEVQNDSNKNLPFIHPGLLHTETDFTRMRLKVQIQQSPWIEGWRTLIDNERSQLSWNPRPIERVVRGGPGTNVPQFFRDVHAAYQLAIRWKITGDAAYANKSISILNAWSSVLKYIDGNADRFLAAGILGFQFANAAEIMRTYPGWTSEDFIRFQNMMLTVFYPMNHDFLLRHNGAAITNYWANWDLCNMASILAIGVLCDRRDIYNEAIEYFYSGGGNGAMNKAVYYIHNDNLGQWQESGRDQGHNTLGIALMGPICEMAWNQGDDLYGYWNNRLLAGAEYVAKYNLGYDVPYQPYMWGNGQGGQWSIQANISEFGRGSTRPMWELIYGHYTGRLGLAAPFTTQSVLRVRPEGGGSNVHSSTFDQLGFGTLTFTRDLPAVMGRPSSLRVIRSAGNTILSWWGIIGVTSYVVKRSNEFSGPYIHIGTSGNISYTDTDVTPGKYYYVVHGLQEEDRKETLPSNVVEISTIPMLYIHLKFDRVDENMIEDVTGNSLNGVLMNNATFSIGKSGNAVVLDGRSTYIALPGGFLYNIHDFTIAMWVYLNDNSRQWPRLFDFGGKPGAYMFLTSKGPKGTARFAVGTVYHYNEQIIDSDFIFPKHQWVHIAVTLLSRVGTIYINGTVVGINLAIDFAPFQLGYTPNNWIGRSQYAADPYLNAMIDDFRIYNGALNGDDIRALV